MLLIIWGNEIEMDYKGSSCYSNGVGMLCKSVFDWVGEVGNGDKWSLVF